MAEKTYWQGASLSVFSSTLVHGGATYPIAEVTSVGVEPLPPDGRVYARVLLGVPVLVWGVYFFVTGVDLSLTWAIVLGIMLAIAGGVAIGFGVKANVEDRRQRNVRISLASGRNLLVAAPRNAATTIADAVSAAIADREPADSRSD